MKRLIIISALFMLLSVVAVQSSLDDGLEAYFTYDTSFNSTFPLNYYSPDVSSIHGTGLITDGILLGSANFSSNTDALIYDNDTNGSHILNNWCSRGNTGSFSVNMWVKIHSNDVRSWFLETKIGSSETVRFYWDTVSDPDRLFLHIRPNTGADLLVSEYEPTLNLETWYPVGFSYNSTDDFVKMYFNGSVVNVTDGSVRWAGNYPQGCASTIIGNYKSLTVGGRDSIDEVRIYNRTLNETEFAELAGTPTLPPSPPPLNGSGTDNDPYQINRCEQIYNISYAPSATYALMQDINCINLSDKYNTGVIFNGTLNGRNHTISNYHISNTSAVENGRNAGLFKSITNTSINNLIINNFSLTLYNSGLLYKFYAGSIFAGRVDGIVRFNQVAIKNSYLDVRSFTSLYGSSADSSRINAIMTDTYSFNNKIISRADYINKEFVASYFMNNGDETIVNNSWSKDTLISPTLNTGNASCFMGSANHGILENNYFNNETCNESLYDARGAIGITDSMFRDPTLPIWNSYHNGAWHLESGSYPILAWEYEKIPRPTILSPNMSLQSDAENLDVVFRVDDNDDNISSCTLNLDGVVNQTDNSVIVGVNKTFTVTGLVDGLHTYNISCTDGVHSSDSLQFTYELDTIYPNITMNYPTPLNTSIANYTFTFDVTATDLNLDTYLLILKYPNGSQVLNDTSTPTDSYHNLTGEPRGIYYVEVFANDTYGHESHLDAQFFIDDTVPPICFGLDSYAGLFYDTYYQWDLSCYDDRKFFSLNISCVGSVNYSVYIDNINQTFFAWSNKTKITEPTTCLYNYCDGHTRRSLREKWKVNTEPNRIVFEVGKGKNKLTTEKSSTFTSSRQKDKIKFNVSFSESGDSTVYNRNPHSHAPVKQTESYTMYYETSGDSYYYKDSHYKSWIVDGGTATWFDLNDLSNDIIADVVPYNDTTWQITITPSSPRRNFAFESAGELNCVSGSQFLNVTGYPSETSLRVGACPETTAGVLVLWLIVGVGLFFMMFGFKYSGIGVMGSIMMLISSWTVAGCSHSGGMAIAGAGLLSLIFFVIKKPS